MMKMKFHPDVLAAHAQFGGDLESMQKCYVFHDLVDALVKTRKLVAEAALTGFNYQDGDWVNRLYSNQAIISDALRKAGVR